jgi:phage/plasmid-associated DNA primase
MEQFKDKITFSCHFDLDENNKKCNIKMPKSWQLLTKSKKYKTWNKTAVLCGNINDLLVIDFDKGNGIEIFNEWKDKIDTLMDKSASGTGYHMYFKYDEDFIHKLKNNGYTIDILTDKNCCYLSNNFINNNSINIMPKEFKDFLMNSNNNNSINLINDEILENDEVENLINDELQYEDIDKVKELVKILTINESDDRDTWIKVGIVLKNILEDEDEAKDIWDDFSKLSKKYNCKDNIIQWNSFKKSNMGIGVICNYAKHYKSKFNKWNKIFNNINSKDNSINFENQKDIELSLSDYYINDDDYDIIKFINSIIHNNIILGDLQHMNFINILLYNNKNNFIHYDNKLYHYNNVYWESITNTKIFNNIQNLIPLFQKILTSINFKILVEDDKNILKYLTNIKKSLNKSIKNLLTINFTDCIFKGFCNVVHIQDNIFNKNPYLLQFTNGVYDLENDIFRNSKFDDYITFNTGYDYIKSTQNEIDNAFKYIDQVMPNKEERDILLLCLAAGLLGITLEKFIYLTGSGRNSKDTLMTNIVPAIYGDYYYLGNTNSLLNPIKDGPNPALANLRNKRIVIYNEPEKEKKLNCATIKHISGAKSLNVRDLYSSDNQTPICPTLFMLCNEIPLLDNVDTAIQIRTIIINFRSEFRSEDFFNENDIEPNVNNIYIGDNSVKSLEFIEKIKLPFLNILLDYFKTFKSNGYEIGKLPDIIKEENKKYLSHSDELTNWINNNYEKTNNKKDVIKCKELFNDYKNSELYQNLDKKKKREFNYNYLIDNIKKNPNLRLFFIDDKKKRLTNYKIITKDNDDYYE